MDSAIKIMRASYIHFYAYSCFLLVVMVLLFALTQVHDMKLKIDSAFINYTEFFQIIKHTSMYSNWRIRQDIKNIQLFSIECW